MTDRWVDLRERLASAAARLTSAASEAPGALRSDRLRAKREGVSLALGYMNEYSSLPKQHNVGVGVAALITRTVDGWWDEVLMIQRGPECSHGAGTWSVPGGWMDFGETPLEAVVREVKEEVNLDLIMYDDEPIGVTNHVFDEAGVHSVCLFYRAPIIGSLMPEIMEPGKIAAIEWVRIGDIPARSLFPHLQKLLSTGVDIAVPA
jgi:8-oxo-dGTP diphosphatase